MSAKKTSSKKPAANKAPRKRKTEVKSPGSGKADPSAPEQAAELPADLSHASAEADLPAQAAKPTRKGKTKQAKADRPLSALDAAAKVLGEAGASLNTRQMIEVMAEKGYWTSPGGKTPAATLFSAIPREINTKGDASRFVKTQRGQFTLRT